MQEFKTLNRNLRLRMLTVFLSTILNSSIGPNMTIYYSQYFGASLTGILLIIVSISGFVSGLYGGHLADVHGRKPIMIAGGWLMIVGFAVAAMTNSPLGRLPVITFFGFLIATVGGSLAAPAEQAMVIDVSTPQNRRFVYALIYWIINISVMLGAALGGWFFRDYLFELLLGLIVVSFINLLITQFGMTETFFSDGTATGSVWQAVRAYFSVLSDHRYMFFLGGELLLGLVTNQIAYYLALHLGRDFKTIHLFGAVIYGQRMLAGMTLINTIMIITMMVLFTRLTRHWPLGTAFAIGASLQVIGFAAACVVDSLWPIVISSVILTVGEMIIVPASQTLRASLMDTGKIGAYSGAFSAISPLDNTLAGATVSLSSLIGGSGMALLFIILGLAAIYCVQKAIKMGLPASATTANRR